MLVSKEVLAPTVAEATQYIEQLDLNYIVDSMCAATYPLPRWTVTDAMHCMRLYKNFLLLFKLYPGESLVPTREIDEFWHAHILYTKKYHRDCISIFGHYLHHEPAMPGDNPEKLVQGFLKTKQLYLTHFQQPMNLIHSKES